MSRPGDTDGAARADAGDPFAVQHDHAEGRARRARQVLAAFGPVEAAAHQSRAILTSAEARPRALKIKGMVHWYESSVDRQLREAQERGEFDNLEGMGKPLPDAGREYEEDWWVRDWVRREGEVPGVLPATLALRKEVEDLPQIVDRLRYEAAVRDRVAEVNERIRKARIGLLDGPPVILKPLDPDDVVRGWRERRAV